jgi:deoxycytidylate deaminase
MDDQNPKQSHVELAADARAALRELANRQPERHPLVVGLVAPLGVAIDPVLALISEAFRLFGYTPMPVRLSMLLDEIKYKPWGKLPKPGERDFHNDRMNAGDKFRTEVEHGSALAAVAVASISESREESPDEPIAFILRSLKHPDEVELLRHVYGDAFVLVGIASSPEERRNALVERQPFDDASERAEALIARDEKDPTTNFGQNVREVYARADVFIPSVRGLNSKEHIERFVDSLFGAPFLTPTPYEEGMRLAYDASLRSSSMARQVGAALIPQVGTPIVIGTNEVPRPGGGQYWTGQTPDFRDFQTGMDPNPLYTHKVVQELLEGLKKFGWLNSRYSNLSGDELLTEATSPAIGESVLAGTRVNALIEFTRCLHAEQAAIVNAARAGVSTVDATLFTTTFPCHECAKFIVGSGISEVHYVEPYPKSLVARLYRDLIDVAPTPSLAAGLVGGKIPFRPFVGIAPRRYSLAFTAKDGQRRFGGSHPVLFDRLAAFPRTSDWNSNSVKEKEGDVALAIHRVIDALSKSPSKDSESRLNKDEVLLTKTGRRLAKKAQAETLSMSPSADPGDAHPAVNQ